MSQKRVEKVTPYNTGEKKGTQIAKMFNAIAFRYDIMNRLISLGQDKRWRRKAIEILTPQSPKTILDIATGTGDMAIKIHSMLSPCRVTGCDISEGMLDVAKKKVLNLALSHEIEFTIGDCISLPFDDNSFDAVTISFGIRNVEDIERGISEINRVLKPSGKLVILELSVPEKKFYKFFYNIYTKLFIPTLGKIITGERSAYDYLRKSIAVVPQGKAMTEIMDKVGMTDCSYNYMTFGACAIYSSSKR
ncbi:MAG: bifunctional demethylmenaquinone methyltransferase/2-methoxy-6-polyprenyl-1,4-benzoquinol methylase UbiE [Bacteroidales bacterium]|nr:bifunctional demethylmenaquinone methyltransferase/2-methoxy-6-polyprenyl-1,4-benzoquinol methylase UbiE [Bacteroidales bacterium]MBR5533020.1 bifunctional demethylmenaquinone methyltransferase/2-methoxy-6-polyprenyl-1,4-benzoquinol methylase UbiE [Bacteroidales bacterium]